MDNINYKLKFQISQVTTLDKELLVKRLIKRLQDEKYVITNVSENSIEFNNYRESSFMSTHKGLNKLQEGEFSMEGIGNGEISLKYYIPYKVLMFISLAMLLLCIIWWTPGYLFPLGFLLVSFLISIDSSKSIARTLLNNILNEGGS